MKIAVPYPIMRTQDLSVSSRPPVIQYPNSSLNMNAGTMTVTFPGSALGSGSTNYLQNQSTGMIYSIQSSTVIGSSVTANFVTADSTVTANVGRFKQIFVSSVVGTSPVFFQSSVVVNGIDTQYMNSELWVSVNSTYTTLASTGVSLSQLWTSANSTYTSLTSTGVSLSQLWVSANSTYTSLASTGVAVTNLYTSVNSTYTSLTSTGISLTNSWIAINSTYTALYKGATNYLIRADTGSIYGLQNSTISASSLTVVNLQPSSITFHNSGGLGLDSYMGMEFLGSTAVAVAISSMSVSFSSKTSLFIVAYVSGTTTNSDIAIRFNNDITSANYFITRTTGASNSVAVFTSSNAHYVLLPMAFSTNTCRTFFINVAGNFPNLGMSKCGNITSRVAPYQSTIIRGISDFSWSKDSPTEVITKVLFTTYIAPGANGNLQPGSYIMVYGRNY